MEDNDFPEDPRQPHSGSHNEDQDTKDLDVSLFQARTNAAIVDQTRAIALKLDSLTEKQHKLRNVLTATRQQHQEIKDKIETMRKQLLYKFNNSIAILALPPIISRWNIENLTLIQCGPDLIEFTGFSAEYLNDKFTLDRLFPRFFKPFAIEFIQNLKERMQTNEGKVSQMVFIETAHGEEIPVQFDCEVERPGLYFIIRASRLAFN
jgi:hypothetical protein